MTNNGEGSLCASIAGRIISMKREAVKPSSAHTAAYGLKKTAISSRRELSSQPRKYQRAGPLLADGISSSSRREIMATKPHAASDAGVVSSNMLAAPRARIKSSTHAAALIDRSTRASVRHRVIISLPPLPSCRPPPQYHQRRNILRAHRPLSWRRASSRSREMSARQHNHIIARDKEQHQAARGKPRKYHGGGVARLKISNINGRA